MGVIGSGFKAAARGVFGLGATVIPLLLAIGAARCFDWIEAERAYRRSALLTGLAVVVPVAAALFAPAGFLERPDLVQLPAAGWLGRILGLPLMALLGRFGAALFLFVVTIALFVATVGWNPVSAAWQGFRRRRQHSITATRALPEVVEVEDAEAFVPLLPPPAVDFAQPEPDVAVEESTKRGVSALLRRDSRRKSAPPPEPVLQEFGDPESEDRPPLGMLTKSPEQNTSLSDSELDRLGQVLIQTLRTFKVEGEIGGRTTGPVVTQFEVVPAPGVKVNRIAALDADLALGLKAPSVRIVAPIPGKGAVGVEVPNPERVTVFLRSLIESGNFQKNKGTLPLALGEDLSGQPYVSDLAKMPHLLIAGATGSGKSICINTLITSLIYRHSPQTLRLLMVDPKMVELSMYGDLPHLRHPVVTDPQDAATVLKWAVLEMERRYALLSENGARSLAEFNRRVNDGQELRRAGPIPDDGDPERWMYKEGPLPFIVVIVDELADLMMQVQAEVEKPLAQLAQKARAIGIHLIVATQRPSVNVITGLIKANFPCRIAFRVSSKVDSRTILDQNGADALLGNGDMLFLPPGSSDPVRVQGAYISTEDTEQLMNWYRARAQERPAAEEDILEYVRSREPKEAADDEDEYGGERDALFRQAAEVCVQFNQGSTSLLQRRLRIGYGRAARIIDQLHNAGVLGPPDGSKPREVLVGLESLDHIIGD